MDTIVNRPKGKVTLSYEVGDIYLAALPDLRECEIEDVAPEANAVKIKGCGWIDGRDFGAAIKARLGRAVYSSGLLGLTRRFIREMGEVARMPQRVQSR